MLRSFLTIWLMIAAVVAQGQLIHDEKYRKELNEKYTSGLFSSDNAHMIVPDDDPSSTAYFNVFQYLQGRVPGLMIFNPNAIGNSTRIYYRSGPPAFFLDEMRVDMSALSNTSLYDIALIKIFRSPFLGVPGGGPFGAIAVYTKRE